MLQNIVSKAILPFTVTTVVALSTAKVVDGRELLKVPNYSTTQSLNTFEVALVVGDEQSKGDGRNLTGLQTVYSNGSDGLEKEIENALTEAKRNPSLDVYLRLVKLYFEKGDNEEMGVYAKKAAELGPRNSSAQNVLGVYFLHKGDTNKAKEQFLRALVLDVNNPAALSNYANAFLEEGNYDRALFYAKKVIAVNPEMFEPYFIKGSALFYTGEFDAAREALETVKRLNPKHKPTLNLLSLIYYLTPPKSK